jgi:aspartate/methionine/tyrosine aminotransferase
VAWTEPKHVEQRLAVFAAKRAVLLELCRQRGLRVHGSQAGLYLWVEVPEGTDGVDYAQRCREVGIVVAPGAFFGRGQERYIRLALVPTVDECKRAAAIWPK